MKTFVVGKSLDRFERWCLKTQPRELGWLRDIIHIRSFGKAVGYRPKKDDVIVELSDADQMAVRELREHQEK